MTLREMNDPIVVARDGSGQFTTVQEAVDRLPDYSETPVTISIKNGVYREKLVVPQSKTNVRFVGESRDGTVLVNSDNAHTPGDDGQPLGTFRSASVFVYGDRFAAERLTIQNDSGQGTGQAVAAFVQSDKAVFRDVTFLGYQDTLYTAEGRQYYENCRIEGDVDFIFGAATAVFDRCVIHSKRSGSYLTAASTPPERRFGYVFLDCRITGDPGVKDVYLGRPWRPHASVAFIRTWMDGLVIPAGWHNWRDPEREKTARYAEYDSRGPGAAPQARVGWSRQLSEREAAEYDAGAVLGGDDGWRP
ncbi:pectinesterase family protein [Paenibacillus sp. GYB003]|uniref:pectinesterase family protein n=1 Tax=Paenibacillus sp. GYB003 TaxID=2994392 RepID=UPI002F9678B4